MNRRGIGNSVYLSVLLGFRSCRHGFGQNWRYHRAIRRVRKAMVVLRRKSSAAGAGRPELLVAGRLEVEEPGMFRQFEGVPDLLLARGHGDWLEAVPSMVTR